VGSTPATEAASWRDLVEEAGLALGSSTEARWILEEVTVTAAPTGGEPDEEARRAFARLVERRRAGEPLQHVLGHWSFRTVDLLVDRRALVPRPETEVVVEHALRKLAEGPGAPLVVDLGTGCGAIACSIASEHAQARVTAIDVSTEAVQLARANRDRLAPEIARRIDVRIGDWYTALPSEILGRVDLVVSNPPYVAESEWRRLDAVVRDFDPRLALVAGPLGTEALASVICGAPAVITDGGAVVVEIAPGQSDVVRELARTAGAKSVEVRRDLAGRKRVLVASW
jgi:release factor glutamine methyltransferase